MDNGSEFQATFHLHVLDKGVQHVYIRPATPRLSGKVERSHRIDNEEFYRMLDGVVIDDIKLFNDNRYGSPIYVAAANSAPAAAARKKGSTAG